MYNNYQANGGDLGAAFQNVNWWDVGGAAVAGAAVATGGAIAAPVVVAAAGELTLAAGVLTGSGVLMNTGITAMTDTAPAMANWVYGTGNVVQAVQDHVAETLDDAPIQVSHYTSPGAANEIMNKGFLKPGPGETNVFVLAGKSTPAQAYNAGAMQVGARVTFNAYTRELQTDSGTLVRGAMQFIRPGRISLAGRNPYVEVFKK